MTPRNKSAAGGADDVQPGLQQSHGEQGQQETQAGQHNVSYAVHFLAIFWPYFLAIFSLYEELIST